MDDTVRVRQGPSTRNKILAAVLFVGFLSIVGGVILTAGSGSGSEVAVPNLSADGAAQAPSGPQVPTLGFVTFDGAEATLADYNGRPLVLNFWASWCPSCIAEMSAAFLPVQERLGTQVAFLGMNIQDERDKALRLVDETGVLFDLGEDPDGDLYTELGGLGMPFTVFVSADGQIVDKHNGPLTEGQLGDKIEELFAVS